MDWCGEQLQEVLCNIAVFPEDMKVPKAVLYVLQEEGRDHSRDIDEMLQALANRSLVYLHESSVSLHDNTRDFILKMKGSKVEEGPWRERHEAGCWALCRCALPLNRFHGEHCPLCHWRSAV